MIQLSLGNAYERERLQVEYLARLINCKAINFGREQLQEYIHAHYPAYTDLKIKIPTPKKNEAEVRTDERFFILDNPGVYHFLFPDDELCVEHLIWLLIGLPPRSNSFPTIRESLEEIVSAVKKNAAKPISKDARERCRKYALRFDRFRTVIEENERVIDAAYWLLERLNIRTCPYCNANFTRVSIRGGFRADLEHFFPKSSNKYPYLMVTLYNLFPACQTCNKLKGDAANDIGAPSRKENGKLKKGEILFPFDESFDGEAEDHIPFRIVLNQEANPLDVFCGKSDQYQILLVPTHKKKDPEGLIASLSPESTHNRWKEKTEEKVNEKAIAMYWERAANTKDLFELESLYETHKQDVRRLIRNHYVYNQAGVLDRARLMALLPRTAFGDEKQLPATTLLRDLLFFANTSKWQWGKAPLNKLKADILDQLEALEKPVTPQAEYSIRGELDDE